MTDVRQVLARMEVSVDVRGSNPTTTRQAKAVAHALARALMSYDPQLKPLLKQAGFGGVRVKENGLDLPEGVADEPNRTSLGG
jgi:ribosomal protein S9